MKKMAPLGLIFSLYMAYFTYLAVQIKIDYSDTFQTFNNVKYLMGFDTGFDLIRPIFSGIIFLPGIILDEYFTLFSNHLFWIKFTNVVISTALLGLVYYWLNVKFNELIALTGLFLLAANRIFFHYIPFALSDTLSAFWAFSFFIVYFHARQSNNKFNYYLAAILLLFSALTKYVMPIYLVPPLIFFECYLMFKKNSSFSRPFKSIHVWISFILSGIFFITILFCLALISQQFNVNESIQSLNKVLNHYLGASVSGNAYSGQSANEYILALVNSMSWPVFIFMLIGVIHTIRKGNEEEYYYLFWLFSILLVAMYIKHKESRYLFAMLPVCYFFVIKGMLYLVSLKEKYVLVVSPGLLKLTTLIVGLSTVIPVFWNIYLEFNIFNSRAFRSPIMQQVSIQLKDKEKYKYIVWAGSFYAVYPHSKPLHPGDDYYSIYHISPFVLTYFSNRSDVLWTNQKKLPALRNQNILFVSTEKVLKEIVFIDGKPETKKLWYPPYWL